MLSQWNCFLENLGEWHGSFTRFSSLGEQLEDIPSVVILEGRENNEAVHQVVRYLPHDSPSRDVVVDYGKNSLNRSILFFETGAFSQGSIQWSPYSTFGGEFGLRIGDRRLRMVQLYNSSAQLERVVLIREKLLISQTPERPLLTVNSLLGQWQGEAVTMYADLRNPERYTTKLQLTKIQSDRIEQKLSFGDRVIASTARIDNSRLLFETNCLPVQILLLPDGASCNCPEKIELGHHFVLEMGWLLQPNLRQRIIRSYNEQGTWTSCTLVTERKIS
ncbi:MAG: DUF3598 family protein [Pleurocapsa sp.]